MSDLTVLVSPIPQYPLYNNPSSSFSASTSRKRSSSSAVASRRNRSPSPIMVTLESTPPPESSAESESAARRAHPPMDYGLLSPPINTWKSRPRSPPSERPRPRHRPTRSQSAPPARTALDYGAGEESSAGDGLGLGLGPPPPVSAAMDDTFNPNIRRAAMRRSHTTFGAGYAYVSDGMTMRGGELVRPPPPLLRPTTFWRRAHRSGVAANSYSPASHLIRRSTFIAAGLTLDAPMHDLSALGVESRVTGEEGITQPSPRVIEIPQALEIFNI